MHKKIALIIIGRFKDEWHALSSTQQHDFVARIGKAVTMCGMVALTGYRLTSTPGAFLQIWEADDRQAIDRAIQNLEAIGYSHYIDARWMIGEREMTQE
jgi:hypothetical protein